jgi:hypothetical protein
LAPESFPVAVGQRATCGTGTSAPALVTGTPVPATFDAAVVHISVFPSSVAWTL